MKLVTIIMLILGILTTNVMPDKGLTHVKTTASKTKLNSTSIRTKSPSFTKPNENILITPTVIWYHYKF